MKKALITGITGMDGSHMADLLLSKGYEVHGLIRRSSNWVLNQSRIAHIVDKITLHGGDLLDCASLQRIFTMHTFDEIYNFAAQSFVAESFSAPSYTSKVCGIGVINLLEIVKDFNPAARFYQASSSEMFGNNPERPYNERSRFLPASSYGAAKVFAHHMCHVYMKSYDMFISCGINFNHESERRGEEFVTRKITKAVARIKAGLQKKLELGNVLTKRDWSYAPDVVEAAWMMLQLPNPNTFVIASGQSHSVEEFLAKAFSYAGLGSYLDYTTFTKNLMRPNEVLDLQADTQRAKLILKWEPQVLFEELVHRMVDHDIAQTKGEILCR